MSSDKQLNTATRYDTVIVHHISISV